LAVVFVGRGIAALQEAGTLPMNPVNIPGIPALGLYPTVQGLILQVLVVMVIASVFAYTRHRAQHTR
jgi:high-affinity iron transporter